ncbi:DUF1616 domain-containing protein [Haloarcula brevis]|uniref:DUF1616 domain-containing protein n=1 Tax=Haloarcula brevis TaxID=3111453 RepID=UPI00300F6B85
MAAVERDDGVVPRADLLAVVAGVAAVLTVAFTPLGEWRTLAVVVGLPFVLLGPGYALVSAVFPRAGDAGPGPGTSWIARLVLSAAGSVVVIAVVGVALDLTVWGFQRGPVVVALAVLTLSATAIAWYRRKQVPADVRAGATVATVRARTRAAVAGDGALGVVMTVLVVVVAAAGVAAVAAESSSQPSVTEFYVLGQDESGDLVAGSYPTALTAGEPVTVGIGVGTTQAAGFDGTVAAALERVRVDGESATVTESQPLGSFDVAVAPGESTVRRHTVRPSMVGDRLRLTYRLYERGSESPFRRVQLWVSVSR